MTCFLADEEREALIRINYQQVDIEMMPSDDSTVRPQRVASLDFNSIDIIGKYEIEHRYLCVNRLSALQGFPSARKREAIFSTMKVLFPP